MRNFKALKGAEGDVIHVAFRFEQIENSLELGQGSSGTLHLTKAQAESLIRELDIAVARVVAANRRAKGALRAWKTRKAKTEASRDRKRPPPPLLKSAVPKEQRVRCQAVQCSDQMYCKACDLTWDINDDAGVPECMP